jgi:hypothetical protein
LGREGHRGRLGPPAKADIYQGFLAPAVEPDPWPAPTAPVRAAITQETPLLQGFCPEPGSAHRRRPGPPKSQQHPVSAHKKTPHLRGFYRGARI